jgi:ATP-dependent DNA helicase RecG
MAVAEPQAQTTPEPPPVEEEAQPEEQVVSAETPATTTTAPDRIAPDPDGLAQPVTVLRGVGPKISELFEKLGATTLHELLYVQPRRYDDYTRMKPIHKLEYGEVVTVIGTVWDVRARRSRNNQIIVQAVITDGSGKVQVTWYNQQWLVDRLKAGMQIVLSGKVEQYLGKPVFNSPEWEPLSEELLRTGRIVPVYPLTKGLSAHKMRQIMKQATTQWAPRVPDPLPDAILERQRLIDLPAALQQIHFPEDHDQLSNAQQRLAFDELLLLQLGMLGQRATWQSEPAIALTPPDHAVTEFITSLPFKLTDAQQRVIFEIRRDMGQDVPMNRLLQGDVGAGKTVVAAAALVAAIKAGVQAALMAPTEILAEQHYKGLSALLEPLGIETRLMTGSTSNADKAAIREELERGSADLVIGTHALIQENVTFKQLGLAVIDEQHRFGVDQRGALRDKAPDGFNPHLLVMSATPIPRSLALSLYGDLDLSILDEMPPGRQEIATRWLRPSQRQKAYNFVSRHVADGRQAFVICPLVEDSDTLDVKSAIAEYERLQETIFPKLKLGLVHGRMKSAEKEAVMREFYAGEIDILVATTVIEVGIDVPNSTIMLIEGANRFGLAQLHQLRGRVGRGEHKSYCILVSDSTSADAAERLTALEDTNDGFQLAEKDLELRGPGEFFGRRQSGMPELKQASLFDTRALIVARREAQLLFEEDPNLAQPEHALLHAQVRTFWDNAGDIS